MKRLLFSVGGMIIRADHVGSTSVPDLPAKQLIDIQVLVDDYSTDKMPWISSALSRAGQWAARSNWSP